VSRALIFGDRKIRFGPAAPAAVHGDDILVAHFLEIIGGERGAETAAAIQDQRGVFVGLEARRQRSSGSGEMASTNRSEK